jgi:thiol-disulfide isomerase/thioredoxin
MNTALTTRPLRILTLACLLAAAGCSHAPRTASNTDPAEDQSSLIDPSEDLGPAPAFSAADTNGVPFTSDSTRGKVVVLDFWATWCAPCVMALPNMQKLADRYASSPDVEVVAIQVDEVGDAAAFFRERNLTLRSIPSARPLAVAFSASGLPMTVVIGKDGRMKLRKIGFFHGDEERLATLVETLRHPR